uniref:protein-L-isoaspartate(D-aspartate) O-methyltransferase n=1 Tax=Arcella intermedia TaxID=1963864 RepID=A0A6B2LHQ5_9EUKA
MVCTGVLNSHSVASVMKSVDRSFFCPRDPYEDRPQSTNCGQTISAPHMHAMCLELLENHLKEGAKVLDVGSGSGILCALFAKFVGPTGKVVGIDIYPSLVSSALDNVRKFEPDLLSSGLVTIKLGDGWLGDPTAGPFDAIHVGAGARAVPQALLDQLKPGGRLVIPVGPQSDSQSLKCIDKDSQGTYHTRDIIGCRYVPLQEGVKL